MLFKITAVFPKSKRADLFQKARTVSVLRDFPSSPLVRPNGFQAAIKWACAEFPGARISFQVLKAEVKEEAPALAEASK